MLLRISGRRILSKMNAFDMVVTVALGSTLATILLNRDVALAEGALAFALLIGMQYLVTWSRACLSFISTTAGGYFFVLQGGNGCDVVVLHKSFPAP
ncbi:hypothetical protein [Methylophaga nitratireducenticrescens]|uniref:hypothetical protein n=1 Tax=Methylophaga nitratireducenticrescens TaxID=754476 RepID=UPI0038B3E615